MVYSATRVFTGEAWLDEGFVRFDNRHITETGKKEAVKNATHFNNAWIIPVFIDAQVYGAGGKLFSLYPEAATLHLMEKQFAKEGTVLFQPTVATNSPEVVRQCIDAVRHYREEGGKAVIGLHLEGPWLNPAKKGAHLEAYIHPPQIEEAAALLQYGKGTISMITLAPEQCAPEIIQLLLDHNIVVSAGHSAAAYTSAMQSFDRGITAVTHLFNAMSPLQHRAPGLVGAAFDHDRVCASIIPDGHHVDPAAIRIAKKIMGERLFAITDAVTETGEGPYQHQLEGDKYVCNGTLSGSAISMLDAARNLVRFGIETGEALRMCSLYPARLLGLHERFGYLAPGYAAKALVVSPDLQLLHLLSAQEE